MGEGRNEFNEQQIVIHKTCDELETLWQSRMLSSPLLSTGTRTEKLFLLVASLVNFTAARVWFKIFGLNWPILAAYLKGKHINSDTILSKLVCVKMTRHHSCWTGNKSNVQLIRVALVRHREVTIVRTNVCASFYQSQVNFWNLRGSGSSFLQCVNAGKMIIFVRLSAAKSLSLSLCVTPPPFLPADPPPVWLTTP